MDSFNESIPPTVIHDGKDETLLIKLEELGMLPLANIGVIFFSIAFKNVALKASVINILGDNNSKGRHRSFKLKFSAFEIKSSNANSILEAKPFP